MKCIARRLLQLALVLVSAPFLMLGLALLLLLGVYGSVVMWKPGGLKVPVAPGVLGSKVNPFVGTGGVLWMTAFDNPAATVPFGMVRLVPDTANFLTGEPGFSESGYSYGDNKIIGFSHTRLLGADAAEGGHFRVRPTVGSISEKVRAQGLPARFSHRQEIAFPGYYAVRLPREGILAELTATPRVGVHRYTFPKGEIPHLLIDVASVLGKKVGQVGEAQVLQESSRVEGHARTTGSFSGRYGGIDVYFVAQLSEPFSAFSTWKYGPEGKGMGVDLSFDEADKNSVVELRLAISYVSLENARENLEAEALNRSFDDLAGQARDLWEDRLSRIQVTGGSEVQQRIFYTALFRAFQMPTTFCDVNGQYMGFDRAVHVATGFRYYTDFSLWDTYRTVHPLYSLIAREDQRDMMVSLVEMAKVGGCLPRWPSGCGYTNCMYGTPADIAVSEAYLKGITDFDIQFAYQAMRQTALVGVPEGSQFAGREGLSDYLSLGYCPCGKESECVARTLDFAWADTSLSLLAQALGYEEDAKIFAEHGQFYRNTWNPLTGYFQPKDSQGKFDDTFRPLMLTYIDFEGKYTKAYCEGSGMQWKWGVPYDPEGLISLFKSPEDFVRQLEEYLSRTKKRVGWWNPGPYYWHGNEPYFHANYLFNHAGRPDLAQKWARKLMDTKYRDTYYGLDGNDDGGTLSAWFVLSALGFYPVAGTTWYELGSPLFDKAEIRMRDKTLTVTAENNGPKNVYVQKVLLNGMPLDRPGFDHAQIAQGGELRFVMGEEGKTEGGRTP